MGISVAVIMKNEEANIADFMTSCLQFADEIVINDTGSTDNSIELASMWPKVKIFNTIWQDNFSKARNYVIEKCSQDWIIWLDLDDRIDAKNADFIKTIAKFGKKTDVFMFNVLCRQYNTKDTLNISQVRMFHKDSGVRFSRAIHENTEHSILENKLNKLYASQVEIVHEGYADFDLLKKKAKRNIGILNKEEVSFSNYYDLGKSYAVLHKYIMAETFFAGAYELAVTDDQKNLIATTILSIFLEKKNIRKINDWLNKLVGDSKITYYYKAEVLIAMGKFKEASVLFKKYLESEKDNVQMFHYSSSMDNRARHFSNIKQVA